MSALKRLNNEIKKIELNEKINRYPISFVNDYDINSKYMSNVLATISVNFNNQCLLNMDIPNCYPFKPPTIFIETNKNIYQKYDNWCGDITRIINSRNYLSQNDIYFAWVFSISDSKLFTLHDVPTRIPFSCICCSSVSCYHNWNPIKKIEDIIDEFIFYKKFIFFSSELGLKHISSIFNNDIWSLPEELILHILQFLQPK